MNRTYRLVDYYAIPPIDEGCITDRKPWDPTPYKEEDPPMMTMRRGHSDWELTARGQDVEEEEWKRGEEERRGRGWRGKMRRIPLRKKNGTEGGRGWPEEGTEKDEKLAGPEEWRGRGGRKG